MSKRTVLFLKFVVGISFCNLASAAIYTCVDAQGRKLTADRPIPECLDRTQKQLSGQGNTQREIGPSLTAQELSVKEAKDRVVNDQLARQIDEKRLDRALVLRYPTRALHDQERAAATLQIDQGVQASSSRTAKLVQQRKDLDAEMALYASDPSKAPAALKRHLEDSDLSLLSQKKFINEQEQEKKRVNQRFDDELIKLNTLWVQQVAH